ncbi:LysR family transcriptional regulator [Orbus hercynius]|uniref:LysR family transcriptional regulator n=1 Tax=Orbus hercynius TaxID=593135 RepID=A0A495RC20_9GAMM|nr:LysR substrate-binding domain-containing protein [Orbus hercynius]RKS84810.1 LysR family transcriptional regulator [Orbus hercynius]
MNVTFEELLAFSTVVNTGSITHAAEQLQQTTSGVSRALTRLEKKLNTTLLRRTTRRLELTAEGQLFLSHALRIIASVEEAEEAIILQRKEVAGLLRVNAATPFMQHVIIPLIGRFRAAYPLIQLELNTDDHIIDLIEKRTDVAIRIGSLKDSSLHARYLGSSQTKILASPAYLNKHGTPSNAVQLQEHTLIGFHATSGLNTWPILNDKGEILHITPTISSSNGEMIRQLALQGEGIVALSNFMTRHDQLSQQLIPILAHDTIYRDKPVNAVYYKNRQLASRISCFLDFLSKEINMQQLL